MIEFARGVRPRLSLHAMVRARRTTTKHQNKMNEDQPRVPAGVPEGGQFAAEPTAGGDMKLTINFPHSTPTKFSNPSEHYARERAKHPLPENWQWSGGGQALNVKAETLAVKADGTIVNRHALPHLEQALRKQGEHAAADFIKSQIK
jgi:hypothetical protein